ncbi:hypothetical protein X926_03765 [Petrotoga sp. HWHPT.55.6.3]|nr:hypothetical protein X926_03765 [Petrotoga sp. HWHPT.55.6.3]
MSSGQFDIVKIRENKDYILLLRESKNYLSKKGGFKK